jgi:hypothetical protein
VPDAILEGCVAVEDADDFERAVWNGYRAGLADAGWAGDERAVRFAFAATPWLKFGWFDAALAAGTLDEAIAARWRAVRPLIDRLGEEARELASRA